MSDKITIKNADKKINLDDLKSTVEDMVDKVKDNSSSITNAVEEFDLTDFAADVKDKLTDSVNEASASFSEAVSALKDKFATKTDVTTTESVNDGSNCYVADKFAAIKEEHPDYTDQLVLGSVLFKVGTEMGIIDTDNYSTDNYSNINKVEKSFDSASLNDLKEQYSGYGGYQLSYNQNKIVNGTSDTYEDVKISYDTGREYTDPTTGNKISLVAEEDGSYTMSITDNGTTTEYKNVEQLTTAELQNIYEGLSTYNPYRSFY